MARFKAQDSKGQSYMLSLNLDEQFSEYSIEKVISRFVEENVKEEDYEQYYKNDKKGQKAYSPKMLLKVILYGLSRGESMRKIGVEMNHHTGYMYLSRNTVVEHSTLSTFFIKSKKVVEELFKNLLCIMQEQRLIDLSMIEVDGTMCRANASKDKTGNMEDFEKMYRKFEKYSHGLVERVNDLEIKYSNGEIDEGDYDEEKKRIDRQESVYKNTMQKIKKLKKRVKKQGLENKESEEKADKGKKKKERRYNLTDDDSRLITKNKNRDGYQQGYNVQIGKSKNDVILHIESETGSDNTLLKKNIKEIEKRKREIGVEEGNIYLLDKGYFSSRDMNEYLEDDKVDLYMPIPDKSVNVDRLDRLKEEGGEYYLRVKDKWLILKKQKDKDAYRVRYKDEKTGKIKEESIVGSIVRKIKQWQRYVSKMDSERGKKIYNKRIGKEHNNHEFKNILNKSRLLRRGKEKVDFELLFSALAFNLRKYSRMLAMR